MSALVETIGETLESKNGEIEVEELTNARIFCLYFTASYCGPSKNFTPFLLEFYNQVNSDKNGQLKEQSRRELEILYVGCDPTENEYMHCYNKTPF